MPGTDGEEKATSACLCKWYWGKGGTDLARETQPQQGQGQLRLLRAKKARPSRDECLPITRATAVRVEVQSRVRSEVRPSSEERLSEGGVWQSDYFRRSARPSWLVWPDFGAGSLGAGDELGYS